MNEETTSQLALIIEDDENLRKFIRLILENKFNFRVLEANDGKQALEIIEKEVPFIIILDLMMPELNGREFLDIIRKKEETKNIPVFVCTAIADKNVIIDLIRFGIKDYIVKPVNPAQLTNKINDFIKACEDKKLTK